MVPFSPNGSCETAHQCGTSVTPIAAGSRWLELSVTQCVNGTPVCQKYSSGAEFQSIRNGEIRSDPTNATTIADLNSVGLARRVCAPLQVPDGRSLAAYSGFFLVSTTYGRNTNPGLYLEHCGSKHRQLLFSAPGLIWNATNRAIIWQPWTVNLLTEAQLNGVFEPSGQHFVIPLPRQFHENVAQIALTERMLYVLDSQNEVWATPAPHPSNRKEHR